MRCVNHVWMVTKMIVSFGVSWEMYGRTSIEIPDDVVKAGYGAMHCYICDAFEHSPLPEGGYVEASCCIDSESICVEE